MSEKDFLDAESHQGEKTFFAPSHNVSLEIDPTPSHKSENQKLIQSSGQIQDELFVRSFLSGKSKNTVRAYQRIISEFFKWIQPNDLKNASVYLVQSFFESREYESRSTRAVRVKAIKSLFTYAQRTGYMVVNLGAFIKGVQSNSKITDRYLTEEEVSRMIGNAQTPREESIIRLLYSGGLRVSELVSLNWESLQAREDGKAQLRVIGKGDKLRVVMVSKQTATALLKLKHLDAKGFEPIFGSSYGSVTRLSDRTVREIVFRLALRSGIKKRVSPHWLRHAHASHALDRGAPIHLVQTTLGHASVATTGMYLHARPEESSE